MPRVPSRRFALLGVALSLASATTGPAAASFAGLADTLGPRPLQGVTQQAAPTLEQVLGATLGPDFRHPGAFLDEALWSVDPAPMRVDPGLRLGTFLWNQVATADLWGVDEYQKWPFLTDVAAAYDAAQRPSPCVYPSLCSVPPSCDLWSERASWADYDNDCPHDRLMLGAYGTWLVLDAARDCGCVDSPQGLAAFERVVTQGLALDDAATFAAKASSPDLWVPMVEQVAEAYGAMTGEEAFGDAPLLVPSLVTQVATILRRYGHSGTFRAPEDAPGAHPLHRGRGQQPPAADAPTDASAGPCQPYVWASDHPVPRSSPAITYANTRTYYFHYGTCAGHVPHQYLLTTEVIHPTVASAHVPFGVASFLTTSGTLLPGIPVSCPDGVTPGCAYRVQLSSVFATDHGGHLDLSGQGGTAWRALYRQDRHAAGSVGLGADASFSEEFLVNKLVNGLAAACGYWLGKGDKTYPVSRLAAVGCIGYLGALGLENAERVTAGTHGEEASGLEVHDAPVFSAMEDALQVTIHPDRTHCRVLREPTWWSKAEWLCPVPLTRRLDVAVEYPEDSGVLHSSLLYHGLQTYPLVLKVVG